MKMAMSRKCAEIIARESSQHKKAILCTENVNHPEIDILVIAIDGRNSLERRAYVCFANQLPKSENLFLAKIKDLRTCSEPT